MNKHDNSQKNHGENPVFRKLNTVFHLCKLKARPIWCYLKNTHNFVLKNLKMLEAHF